MIFHSNLLTFTRLCTVYIYRVIYHIIYHIIYHFIYHIIVIHHIYIYTPYLLYSYIPYIYIVCKRLPERISPVSESLPARLMRAVQEATEEGLRPWVYSSSRHGWWLNIGTRVCGMVYICVYMYKYIIYNYIYISYIQLYIQLYIVYIYTLYIL